MLTFANAIKDLDVKSSLFDYNDKFFLALSSSSKKVDIFAGEFLAERNSETTEFLKEHAKLIFENTAVEELVAF